MLMEFKLGDRVHVTRLEGKEVDFFTTLQYANLPGLYQMIDSTDSNYNECFLWKSNQRSFGPDEKDYYTLATDEEDTEEPVIQRVQDNVNHPSHYNFGDIEVVDFIEQVTKHYNSDVAYHIGNAIKYISRAPHKNGKEDIAKAKWYIERAFENWE